MTGIMVTETNRKEAITLLEQGYELVKIALAGVPAEVIDFRPGPGRWTVHEIICHLADSEANAYVRLRKIVAENGSSIAIYDQDTWAQELHYAEMDHLAALELFRLLRAANHAIITSTSDIVWATHAVNHPEKGSFTLDDWLRTYSQHIPGHIRQIERNMEAWRKASEG